MQGTWYSRLIPLLVVLGALAPAAAGAGSWDDEAYTKSDRFTWSGRVRAGETVEVKGINGDIVVELSSGSEVSVDVRKRGKKSDPEDVRIEVIEHEDGVTICARYPRPDGTLNDCEPGDGGEGSKIKNNDVRVDFRVRIPAGAHFVGRTVNGGIEADGLKGDVNAETVNGSVTISTSGQAAATTVNGSITARMGEADWDGDLEFTTVNGAIRLELPEDLDADVSASTVNGNITTDFPLTVSGKFSSRKITGKIGRGGRDLSLTTVNGSIHLRAI